MGKCPALHDVYEVPALLSNGIIHTMVTAIRRMPPGWWSAWGVAPC